MWRGEAHQREQGTVCLESWRMNGEPRSVSQTQQSRPMRHRAGDAQEEKDARGTVREKYRKTGH